MIDWAFIIQLLSHVWLFPTPWTVACQVSLSFTISQSLLKLMSIELLMPSNHLILCCPFLLLHEIFPSIRVFSNESSLFQWVGSFPMSRLCIRWPEFGGSASILPVNIQGWFPCCPSPLATTSLFSITGFWHLHFLERSGENTCVFVALYSLPTHSHYS